MNTTVYQIIKIDQGPNEQTAVSAIRPESPNLAAGQGGGNEPPARTKKKEKQTPGLRMDAPGPRRSVDDGLGKLPDGDFRASVRWPTPTPIPK